MITDLSRSFDLSDGITFDDSTGIVYGADPPQNIGGSFPLSTLYIQTTPPTLWQLTSTGWVSFGSSAIPQNVIDVTDRLTNVYVDQQTGALVDNTTNLSLYETCVSWAGKYVEDGDTMPVAYKMRSDAGHLMTGNVVHIAVHGDIKDVGDIDIVDDTGTVLAIQVPVSGNVEHSCNVSVSGVVKVMLSNGIKADTLYIDMYYRRSL